MKIVDEEYQCKKCGTVRLIYRKKSQGRKIGHVKPMFCLICNKERSVFIRRR